MSYSVRKITGEELTERLSFECQMVDRTLFPVISEGVSDQWFASVRVLSNINVTNNANGTDSNVFSHVAMRAYRYSSILYANEYEV